MKIARPFGIVVASVIWLTGSVPTAGAAAWPMKQGDREHTGRADYIVPPERLVQSFFDIFLWQKPAPGSPGEGGFSYSSMVFFDGAGPGGADIAACGYHWPKGIQAVDRHSGALLWSGNPEGGERIGLITPAFSNDGSTLYTVNDATESTEYPNGHPLMAFPAATGPSNFRHNGADASPNHLSRSSPTVAADGRVFLHQWDDRPYAGADDGQAIAEVWAAETYAGCNVADPSLYQAPAGLRVVVGSPYGAIHCYDGGDGTQLWETSLPGGVESTVTIDPSNGNIYVGCGHSDVHCAGMDIDGNPLWGGAAVQVYDYIEGTNDQQTVLSSGCLSWDGATYYFQTISSAGEGRLYAINTATGAVKWSFETHSAGWWDNLQDAACPIVTRNGVVVVGNNRGDTYYAILDEGVQGTLVDTLPVNPDQYSWWGHATSSPTMSPDGMLYLPLRVLWTASNGDGETPTMQAANLFCAIDLTSDAQVVLAPPPWQAAFPLNDAVRVTWQPVNDPAGVFDHYAVYRAGYAFDSIEGMMPIAMITDIEATEYLDETALNGTPYYYAVTSVTTDGAEATTLQSVGPRTPVDETDLQVASISRLPRYPRYWADYTYYTVTEPNGFGPYSFSASTGLGGGQDESTQRWPNPGDTVTYRATVRNRGTNTIWQTVTFVWRTDDQIVATLPIEVNLAPGSTQYFDLQVQWDGVNHRYDFTVDFADDRVANNSLSIWSKSVAFLTFVDTTRLEEFRVQSADHPEARTDDMIDWLNLNMARFNELFAAKNCDKRVHFDVLEVIDDFAADPNVNRIDFAIFPFRYLRAEGDPRLTGYYDAGDDIDYGLLHEWGHQLGMIDLYRLNMGPDQNQVTRDGYSGPECLMNGCSHFLSDHTANAMNHWMDAAHGYYGQYLYQLPENVKLRFRGLGGAALANATVTVYQKCERPGMGEVITDQAKGQGVTDAAGEWAMPNVPIDPQMVPPAFTGDTLHDNPFGYVAVVGTNGVLLIKVEKDGFTDYCWLDITEVNNAYWAGQTQTATIEREVLLGGAVQTTPPDDLTELNASSWTAGRTAGG